MQADRLWSVVQRLHRPPPAVDLAGALELAEVPTSYAGPLEHLRVVRMRPSFEPAIRLLIVDGRRLPDSTPGAAA